MLDIARTLSDDTVPEQSVYYHTECRRTFTHKRDLETLQKLNESSSKSEEEACPSTSDIRQTRSQIESGIQSPQPSRVYAPVCIFCDKTGKYKKGTRTRETLTRCGELRADTTVRQRAIAINDTKIIAILSRELVAAEGHYHHSCYMEYTRPDPDENKCKSSSTMDQDLEHQLYVEAEKNAYVELFKQMRDMFSEPNVKKLSELRESLKSHMVKESGISEIKESTRTHMLRKINSSLRKV